MAENTESFCGAVTAYLGDALGISIEYVSGIPWQERERLFDAGEIQILWLCGLPYVQKADRSDSMLELLAAPIPTGALSRQAGLFFRRGGTARQSLSISLRPPRRSLGL
jgi:phosphonate transport system substrate-binding protein